MAHMLTLPEEGVFAIWARTSKITNDLFSLYKSYVVFFLLDISKLLKFSAMLNLYVVACPFTNSDNGMGSFSCCHI